MALKCVAIDDEPLALELIKNYVNRFPSLEMVRVFEDAISGAEFLNQNSVDLLFLDVNMPDITGVELAKSLVNSPMVIFTTAYRSYAFESYELQAIDYLLKPIDFNRFSSAVEKAMINALTKVLDVYNLPVFSMPFSLLTIALLYFFMLRTDTSGLQLTSIQNYAPEINLYQSLNGEKRYQDFKYISVYLPFMGTWTVSQDYHGAITHRGDWSEALDFVITDIDGKTFEYPGNKPEHYYCFNKPVLACADGFIEEIIQHIEDNEIGQVNLEQNWGNTIIIKHLDGLYSKVSHLKHRSAKFKPGDFVKQGDIIAMCGNSGRSPEPHLHFQFQSTPYIGSKTLAYPFAYYEKDCTLQTFTVPQTGEKIQQLEINSYLKHAFNFQPGYRMEVVSSEGKTEIWEVLTDLYNQPYFYCRETQCLAYFVKNANCFYFTRYYGTKDSLMYYFYLAAYKILFSLHEVQDTYAIDPETIDPRLWLQDVLAPFFIFTTNTFKSRTAQVGDQTSITTTSCKKIFAMEDNFMEASIHISKDGLERFETRFKNHNIITCEVKSI